MFDVIFSGTNEEQQRKANLFEVGLKQRMKEEAASFAEAVVAGDDGAFSEVQLGKLREMREAHEQFGKDPRLAALNKWAEEDNEKRTKQAMVEAITDRLLSHLR